MKNSHHQRDFISRAGTTMTVVAWLIFLAILFAGFDFLVSQRLNPNQNISTAMNGIQKEVVLQRNTFGHYVTHGTINDEQVTFLLDTGATDIAIPETSADRLKLKKGRSILVKTANGNVRAYRTRLESVAIGEIRLHDLNATILTNMAGSDILLGMSYLKHFEITQKGKTLTIRQ